LCPDSGRGLPGWNLVFLRLSEAANNAKYLRVGRTVGNDNYNGRYTMNLDYADRRALPCCAVRATSSRPNSLHLRIISIALSLLMSTAVMAAPSPQPDLAVVDENNSVTIDVAANDGPDAIPSTVLLVSGPANGSANNNGDGTFDYTPDLNYFGPDNFVYSICDAIPECAQASVSIRVNSVPTLTLNGPATVNLGTGDTYNEQGATATDVEDGDLSGSVVIGGDAVNTSDPDSYVISYDVSDLDGAAAPTVFRTVNVTDDDPPVISLNGAAVINLNVGDSFSDPGFTAFDNVDGDLTADVEVGGDTVNTAVPDTYVITYNVSDSAGNAATEVTRTVNVSDGDPPVITLIGAAVIDLSVGDTFSDPGVTASDDVDGDLTSNVVVGGDTVNTAVPGTYVISYNVSDLAGNAAAEVTRTVIVIDDEPPVITLIGAAAIDLNVGDNFIDPGVTATDNVDGDLTSSVAVGGDVVNTGVAGTYVITYNVSDSAGNPAAEVTRTVNVNGPPTAINVSISVETTPQVGQTLTGQYTYSDAENDPEGASTFRWLRNGNPIPNATDRTYVIASPDKERTLQFEVTPVAQSGASPGDPVLSAGITISNTAPSITGQNSIEIQEDTSREIVLADLVITDLDDNNCQTAADCTLSVLDGQNYTRVGNVITPAADFDQALTVPVRVDDGSDGIDNFPLLVTVVPVNDAPTIMGVVAPITTEEDTPLTIRVEDLVISDPDNAFPADFTLVLQDGVNYTRSGLDGNTIVPAKNFNGTLSIPATVSDLEPLTSAVFNITLTVSAENDSPTPDLPIDPQTAIENTPFQLDVSGNFSDADGDTLAFSTVGLPPSLGIDPATGVISGTPGFEDARDNEPYVVVVTAQDSVGAFATAAFDLTVSALDRANLALLIDVSSEAASPSEELRWTFSAINPIGPQPGQDVELTGRFVGTGITVSAEAGTSCTIDPTEGTVTQFMCTLGGLPIGGTLSVVLTTSATQATEIVVFATAAGALNLPIDPNIEDNSAFEAAGVAESFSNGAVQFLGDATIRSVAAGDINGDGMADIIAGTAAGQPVQIFLGDLPRESCDCPRDFLVTPLSIASNGAHEGVALADFDRNGSLDIVVANDGGLTDVVFFNDGAGNFGTLPSVALTATFAKDVAVGDFNGDANPDIVIAAVGGNPVFLGDGTGAFTLEGSLGTANSSDVSVADFDGDGLDDVVVANIGSASQVWLRSSNGGFVAGTPLVIGDATSVLAADVNGSGGPDLVFGRIPADDSDVPSNPVLLNDGTGTFGSPSELLGLSPTNDVLVGEINGDGLPDLVFVNASGVHQIWTAGAAGYSLHRVQIIDGDAQSGLLGGIGVYLNDGAGNLGRGDAVPPVLTLLGESTLEIDSGAVYRDAGASALDNIDGDISGSITVTGAVNTAVVGNYTLTYNVSDFAGNAATAVTRTVTVAPAAGTGGGGGGAISIGLLTALAGLVIFLHWPGLRARRNARAIIGISKDDPDE
jgi:hypothetical protein